MRMLIVDDHELIQNALRLTLHEIDPQCEVAVAKDFDSAAGVIDRQQKFDLVLLDLGLPGMNGLTSLVEMRARYPELPVVVVSGQVDRASVVQAINMGAMGFIPKTLSGESIIAALRIIVSGEIYIPPDIIAERSGRKERGEHHHVGGRAVAIVHGGRSNSRESHMKLTHAQLKVLALLLRGLPNKLICRELHVEESTVKSHIKRIFAALDVKNRTQAVLVASQMRINVNALEQQES